MKHLWIILVALCAILPLAAEDQVSWNTTPAIAGPGQPFRLQVHIESDVILGAAERVVKELKPPRGMALRFSGQLYRSNTTEATLNFSGVAPEEEGTFVIPSFNVRFTAKMVKIPEITLHVSATTGFRKSAQARAELTLPDRTYYVGERIPGVVHLLNSEQETITGSMGLECEAEGFSYYFNGPPKNTDQGMDLLFELTPTRVGSGEIILNGSMFLQSENAFLTSGRDRPYAFRQRFRVEHVPEEGRPADWTGGIGKFTAESVYVSNTKPEVGEPIKMTAVLAGVGNLERIIPPEIAGGDVWEVLPATERRRRAEEERMFVYSIVPRLPGKQTTPVIKFSTFDPSTKKFTRLEFPVQVINVTGTAPAKVDLVTVDPAAPVNQASKSKVSDLMTPQVHAQTGVKAIIPLATSTKFWATNGVLIVTTTVLLSLSLLSGYLLLHPEIVTFYRARRDVKKALRQAQLAQQQGKHQAFAAAIVMGLRAGCGAILSATPQALTQSDVLRVLPQEDKEFIDRLFRLADGDKFGGQADATLITEASKALTLLQKIKAQL
jgi:hypothetical protein